MKDTTPRTIHLKDYKKPEYLIPEVYLNFIINKNSTVVKSKLKVVANYSEEKVLPLVLNGEKMNLLSNSKRFFYINLNFFIFQKHFSVALISTKTS